MKFMHVDSMFRHAATRSRPMKFQITPSRWLTTTGSKWTWSVTEVNDSCSENKQKHGRGLKLFIKPTSDLESLISKCLPFTATDVPLPYSISVFKLQWHQTCTDITW